MHTLEDETFSRIAELMYSAIGLSLPQSKKALVTSRLAPRIQRLRLAGFEEYFARITQDEGSGEFQVAVDLLTTNETYFFREPAHFELLERELGQGLRRSPAVWSAASSFGDEAYSAAMVLADLQTQGRIEEGWSVLGTDISDRVLRTASQGIFPGERLHGVSRERLRRYCLRGEGESEGLVQIQPVLRDKVRFGQLNLCRPVDELGPFDIIFLRNVLIYFDAPTKQEVVERVLGQLRPGGLLFIGTAEGRIPCATRLESVRPGAFRKLAS